MLFSDLDIKNAIKDGKIAVKPLKDEQIGPASIDLTLSDEWYVFKDEYKDGEVDLKKIGFEEATEKIRKKTITLKSGEVCLGKTVEKITLAPDIMGMLEGRSRYARMGLSVHITSALVQPGSDNHQVLEIVNFVPFAVKLHAGMRITQIIFHEIKQETSKPYAKFGKLPPNSSKSDRFSYKNDLWLYALIAGGIMIVIILASASLLGPQVQSAQLTYIEEPLQKQALQIKPGEYYRYDYTANLSEQKFNLTLTYIISRGDGCVAIYIRESQNKTPTCINEKGNDETGANVTLGNPLIYLFKPWMLAVNENWQWHATAYLPLPTGELQVAEVYFLTAGTEEIKGRNAYKVIANLKIKDEPDQQITYWIDENKRVLLMEEGPDYKIEIASSSLGFD